MSVSIAFTCVCIVDYVPAQDIPTISIRSSLTFLNLGDVRSVTADVPATKLSEPHELEKVLLGAKDNLYHVYKVVFSNGDIERVVFRRDISILHKVSPWHLG